MIPNRPLKKSPADAGLGQYDLASFQFRVGKLDLSSLFSIPDLISPDPQPPVAGCASPTAEHTAT